MADSSIIVWLFAFTLAAALAIGIWQFFRVRKSQEKRGEAPGAVKATSSNRAARGETEQT